MDLHSNSPTDSTTVKLCLICGDYALGLNFGGLSCESCKSFFRRTVTKNAKLQCKKWPRGKCDITKENRQSCQSCRLAKCFAIGMKNESISGANKRVAKLQQSEFQLPNAAKIPKSITESSKLQQFDLQRIAELRTALKVLPDESNFQLNPFASPQKEDLSASLQQIIGGNVAHIINLQEYYVCTVVRCLKRIESFRCLKPLDRLTLLKEFYPEFTAFYSSLIFNVELDGLCFALGSSSSKSAFISLKSLQLKDRKTSDIFRQFVSPIKALIGGDVILRDLIIALLLFKPRNTIDISCPEFIKYNYALYCHLLSRYIEFRCERDHNSQERFSSLMALSCKMAENGKTLREMTISEMDPAQLKPILVELYNLD